MSDIAGRKAVVERKRRPSVHTAITREPYDPHWHDSSGVELILTRAGVEVFGFYDSMVGIEGFRMTWAEFDAEREALK